MPMYMRRGEVPKKRHTQFWLKEALIKEEVFGLEGFSGNESMLYHLNLPPRIKELGGFEPIRLESWTPDTYAHRHFQTTNIAASGDAISGRKVLLFNNDVEMAICRPEETMSYFYRNGEGDELIFVHEGSGVLETIFGDLPYQPGDYIVMPRGITYKFSPQGAQRYVVFTTPGQVEIPRHYRNEYGQMLQRAPFHHRDIHTPTELKTHDEKGDFVVRVRVRGGYQTYMLDYHPFDLVGWDGYVYPWTFNIADFEPITGRVHVPPTAHQTFQGQNFVICSFCPRPLDWDKTAVPIPYYHSNLNSEEVIYYVSGNFGSRKRIEVGSVTLHPSGIPHGPQPGLMEKSLGATWTDEMAVMCDTFKPLQLTQFAKMLNQPEYPYSWQ